MISVIIPTYNVEKYISFAIESIVNQTYTNWELIIVDDCSSDKTVEIVKKYATSCPKIHLIKRAINSGGARQPRFDGILTAKGEFVTHIDADDFVERDYLQKMLQTYQNTQSTIVLSKLQYCTENGGHDDRQIPNQDFDFTQIMSGEEACMQTLGSWKINLAGLLTKTSFYQDFVEKLYDDNCNSCFNDELDYRKLLSKAKSVAFSNATYFYRQQPQSVVHLQSSQYIDRINQIKPLYQFISTTYPNNLTAIKTIQSEYINYIYIAKSTLYSMRKTLSKKDKTKIEAKIKEAYDYMKQEHFIGVSFKQKMILKSYFLLSCIVYFRQLYLQFK